MKLQFWIGVIAGGCGLVTPHAQTVIEGFEYASDTELLSHWAPSGETVLSLSDSVAPKASGTKSMKVDLTFPSSEWSTVTLYGPTFDVPLSIGANQFISFRLRGDPAFAGADFRTLYLYAYDLNGNFGRWGLSVPTVADWQIVNFPVNPMEQPWNSPGLPDLTQIVRFDFYQYGSQAAIPAYTATIYIDELTVRDAPLTEFPAPAAPRALLDDFESYGDGAALLKSYSYQNSPSTTVTTASLDSAAPQGSKALKLTVDFAAGQWPWGSVMSGQVAPFSLPTNAVVSFKVKGDPSLAALADDGTAFLLSFYDKGGGRINYVTAPAPVISSDWTTLQATLQDFGDTSTVDIGNLVQWRILVEGWHGTDESAALTGTFSFDDFRITVPAAAGPSLTMSREGAVLKIGLDQLAAGARYELKSSGDLKAWTTAAVINATSASATWTVPAPGQKEFFQLVESPAN